MVPDCKDPAVLSLYNAGILTGSDQYGSFRGSEYLNRGQAAAILARLADPAQRVAFSPVPFDLCADVLGVDGDTVLLTVGGESVTAELFAYDLCDSLHRGGGTQAALEDAIRNWCFYDAPFRVLAEEIGMGLTAEEQAQAAQAGRNRAGYLGVGAAYWQYKQTGVILNGNMRMLYWQKDWKTRRGHLSPGAGGGVPGAVGECGAHSRPDLPGPGRHPDPAGQLSGVLTGNR